MAVSGIAKELEALFAEALKAVWRRSRLECAATHHLNSERCYRRCDCFNLVAALDRTWTGHHDDLVSANLDILDANYCALWSERPGGQLVRCAHSDDFVNAVQQL